MIKIKSLLRNRNFIIFFAVLSGMLFHHGAQWTRYLILPMLSLIMTLSIMELDDHKFQSFTLKSLMFPAFLGILMNYAILGNMIIFMSAFLIHDESLWSGLATLAAVPSAVAVIPFTRFLNGNKNYATVGVIATYIGALVITPLIALGLLDTPSIDATKLLYITILLIVFPIIISGFLIWKRMNEHINPLKRPITNWSFFLITYTLVGLNRNTLINHPFSLVPMAFIAFMSTFFLGFLIQWIGTLFHINKANLTALSLIGTLKNYGLAGGLAIYLFSIEAALPAIVFTICMTIYVTWLDFKAKYA